MNVKEKLEVFTKTVMADAEDKRCELLEALNAQTNKACEDAFNKAQAAAADMLKKEDAKIEQMKNKYMIDATTKSKKELIVLRTALLAELEAHLVAKLVAFSQTADYEAWLLAHITACAQTYTNIDVVLTKDHMHLAPQVASITGGQVSASDEDFIGGFKAIIQSRHALADHTFAAGVAEEMKQFNQIKIQ